MARALGAVTSPVRDRGLLTSAALAGATVLAQIAYPLVPAGALGGLSVLTVLLFCAANLTHATGVHGWVWAARLAGVVLAGSFAAETLGVATGFPFGSYAYADSLGPRLAGVPWLVPLAWLMMAYPCLVMAGALVAKYIVPQLVWRSRVAVPLAAGASMAAWDVFLDPQMVAAGHWTWADPTPSLPGVDDVPLTNLAGWLLVAVLVMALVDAAAPLQPDSAARRPLWLDSQTTPAVMLGWTWIGGIVGNALFFNRSWVAVWGGVLLGLVVAPYLGLVRDRWRG